ncbi:helix-turn-helix domain-containing protein [Catenibacterium mitsuokai]|uniref:helix-turn-helix domain-containing protein n=1 Tax=Catenibacterium mitsuokai TaxID=100886 RepID=UPI001FED35F3|nr:helix-turn-helix domain-containing protein [Catenibacterium mitsuokai]
MRKLLKSFKTEINPTEEQKVRIRKTIGTCRFIYNFYLAHNKELHESGKKFMSSSQCRVWLNNEYLPLSRIFLDKGSLFKIGNTGSK